MNAWAGGLPFGTALAAAGGILLLAVLVVVRVTELGSPADDVVITDWTYRLLVTGCALAVVARAVLVAHRRTVWAIIAIGLAGWAADDLSHALGGHPTFHPAPTEWLYLPLYVALIGGLRMLGGRLLGARLVSLGLIVTVLGLATLWSWVVFSDALLSAAGGHAVARTLAFPLLDLLLLTSLLLALAARSWRADGVLAALAVAVGAMTIGDGIYAVQVASGTYSDGSVVEAFWPAGALAIALAAWLDRRPAPRGAGADWVAPMFAVAAIAIAVAALTADHFERLDTLTVVFAALTLLGGIVQLVLVYRDRAGAHGAVEAASLLRRVSIDAALDCIISIDGAGKVVEWNDAARHTFGYPAEDALGRELAELIIPPALRDRHRQGLARVVETGERRILGRRIEVMATHAHGGAEFPVELTVTRVQADPPLFTAFIRDISERRRREEENERLAAIIKSSEDAILSKDLNGVVTAWNRGAEMLYGYTAEEAVGTNLADLIVPADRVDELERVTASVLAGQPAVFETKRQRRDGELIDVSLRAIPIRNLVGEVIGASTTARDITHRRRRERQEREDREGRLWRGRIESALDQGGLMFWGQPIVDVVTGAVHHHELLLRMDVDGAAISPNHFLPHAEGTELITRIDRWAVREGAAFARELPVAINLSARSLDNPGLLDEIKTALAEPELAGNVTFEITETAAVGNIEAARELVDQLRELGCSVALDDFGTGYGSFTYLKHLAVSHLKIDIDFVRGLTADPTDQKLVRSIVSVARNFNMETVAEGVEDELTMMLLRSLGVDFAQGYHIGYPTQMTTVGRRPATAEMGRSSGGMPGR